MDPKAVLFDLDMTLVDSSRLAEERANQEWGRVLSRIGEVRPFPPRVGPAPHELPALLKERGKAVAVVTSSPEPYAREVLKRFGIAHDVLVSSKDTAARKPFPEPLKLAMERLGVPPGDCISIGDDAVDAEAAYHAGVTSVGALWRFDRGDDPLLKVFWASSPDIALSHPWAILHPELLGGCRYVGEAIISGVPYHPHDGFRLYWRESGRDRVECLGRYFVSGDVRSRSAAWTRRILALKDDHSVGAEFAGPIAGFLGHFRWRPDSIVPVPPKLGEGSRFAAMLEALPPLLGASVEAAPDGLVCDRPVLGYKDLDHAARDGAIRGTIRASRGFSDRRVLLLDDVLTSGSTVRECAGVLRRAGAVEVRSLALGLSQKIFYRKECPRCGRSMRIRARKSDGSLFWGCSGYVRGECRRTVPLAPGEVPH